MEQWKKFPLDSKYEVSDYGRVRNRKLNIMKTFINNSGYEGVRLSYGKHHYVHRMVAISWLGMSDLTVNHKDGNKLNNHVDNLEWLNYSDNHKHAYNSGLKKRLKKTVVCLETGKIYYNCKDASLDTNIPRSAIRNAANPKSTQKKAGGLHWQYV